MEDKSLVQRLEEFIKQNNLEKHGNWGHQDIGAHGIFTKYYFLFNDHAMSTQLVMIKIYKNGRPKGKYSVLLESPEFNTSSDSDVLEKVEEYYNKKTKHL